MSNPTSPRLHLLRAFAPCLGIVLSGMLASSVAAQTTAAGDTANEPVKLEKYVVTGSSIKRLADEGATPIDIYTPQQLDVAGVTSMEQMISQLNINGNSIDNLASNSDVVSSGTSRGFNGVTAANLRMQGSNSTLILLNGRRVAQASLGGAGVVDLNSIPFEALKRVEVLKDGASSIYGTEAIGGVINFILRDDYQGLMAKSSADVTQEGGGNIYRFSVLAGYGDLHKDHYNVMAALTISDSKLLLGTQRDWVNTQQPNRGLSADTRGTPYATIIGLSTIQNVLSRSTTTTGSFIDPATGLAIANVNTLVLQGASALAGTGMYPYDVALWPNPGFLYSATMDTGKYAALQQPLNNKNLVTSGKYKLGEHTFTVEGVFGRSESTKWFSPSQITSSTAATTSNPAGVGGIANPFFNLGYPSTGADYNKVFNILVAAFPQLAPNFGTPMPIRWRFYPGGDRRYTTHSNTWRVLASAEGPLSFLKDWDYRAGISRSNSSSYSVLSGGYYYTQGIANLINTGVLDPFSFTQTPAAMAALEGYSATGVHLYGGTYRTDEFDVTTSGPIYKLPAGTLQGALGLDYRKDTYSLTHPQDPNLLTSGGLIANAPFDFINATGDLTRSVRAVFGELDIPVVKGVDFNPSARMDDYSGFGRTTNPKYTLKIVPVSWLLFRGSYSTGFRVPTFGQEYYPTTVSPATNQITDPVTHNTISSYNIWTGGKLTLEPEKAKMKSAGVVINPNKHLSFSMDWWSVERTNTITTLGVGQILANYTLFPDRLIRSSPTSDLTAIDNTYLNAGGFFTEGIEFGVHANTDAFGGRWDLNYDLSDLLVYKSKLLPNQPYGASLVATFPNGVYGELGLKYKSTGSVTYTRGKWAGTLTQIYRSGYLDQPEGKIATGTFGTPLPPDYNPHVSSYTLYNLMVTYKGLIKDLTITAGVKNLFNTHPPFASYYDTNSGAGANWDPRVGDPRDRSFVLSAEYKFF